ncbi:hypothetical protein HHI36_011045 [Cryptolaemus montrouzieri]|uniref:Lymphoid-restricted membrane protein n=1 Tax=Cryptolaemus montrouzieri TaxID=559131 RepID=A0ABD2MKL4_9CUCU
MKGLDRRGLNQPKLNLNSLELNNNNSNIKMLESNESLMSGVSSVTSFKGDLSPRRCSEDFDVRGAGFELRRQHSSGESTSYGGSTEDIRNEEQIDVFPSIPNELLEGMGLIGEQNRKIQSEEELEQKFATLSLSFSIDSTTIKDRCERQRRYRDQTEKNLAVEIERLTERVNKLTKLCINKETTELLSTLLAQIDIVMNASALASSSAERYGAVQHEERLSEAVQLMVNHVNCLKQQRDLSRKQLQYTKRVLQDTNFKEGNSTKEKKLIQQAQNTSLSTKRRASIAISTLQDNRKAPDKSILRRTSELSFRTTAMPKLTKPSRMDLGVDLGKIKEGMVEEVRYDESDDHSGYVTDGDSTGCDDFKKENGRIEDESRSVICRYLDVLHKRTESTYNEWSKSGTISYFFYMCSVLCFCFGIIIMADILFELELAKR